MGYTIKICARKQDIEIISKIWQPIVENHVKKMIKLSPNLPSLTILPIIQDSGLRDLVLVHYSMDIEDD